MRASRADRGRGVLEIDPKDYTTDVREGQISWQEHRLSGDGVPLPRRADPAMPPPGRRPPRA